MNIKEGLIRQSDIIPERVLDTPINIVGAGAIGSFTTLSLAKMGFFNIHVQDYDEVSVENMSCQFYRPRDIGEPKVKALFEIVREFSGIEIGMAQSKFDKNDYAGIVIAAVDSMAARREIYEFHKKYAMRAKLFIDPRMSAESIQVHVVEFGQKDQEEAYEKTLYSDEEAVQERCTAKSTMYTVLSVSGAVVNVIKAFLTRKTYHRHVYWDVPSNDLQRFGLAQSV